MNPQEHYNEAVRLLDGPQNMDDMDEWRYYRADNLAEAQVHATLALAGFIRDNQFRRLSPGFPG